MGAIKSLIGTAVLVADIGAAGEAKPVYLSLHLNHHPDPHLLIGWAVVYGVLAIATLWVIYCVVKNKGKRQPPAPEPAPARGYSTRHGDFGTSTNRIPRG